MTLLKSTTFWALALFVGLYVLTARALPNPPMQEILRVMAFSSGMGGLVAFWPDFRRAVGRQIWDLSAGDILAMALWLFSSGLGGQSMWGLLFRLAGQPAWMQNNDLVTFFLAVYWLALSLVIIAPGLVGEPFPPRARWRVAFWVGVGASIAGLVILARPDSSALVERIRPYLEEPLPAPSLPPELRPGG